MKTYSITVKHSTRMNNGKPYDIEAELVKNFNATPEYENTAWHGTLMLYKDAENRYYLEDHSGLSSTNAIAVDITDYSYAPEELTLEQASRLYNGIYNYL